MPEVFTYPRVARRQRDQTFFQVLIGPGTAFEREGLKVPANFPDGTSNTITVVEAAEAVPWTKPVDLSFAPGSPLPAMGAVIPGSNYLSHSQIFVVSLVDGSSRSLNRRIAESTLRAAITRNGNEKLGTDWGW